MYHGMAKPLEAGGEETRQSMHASGNLSQPVRTVITGVHRCHVSQ